MSTPFPAPYPALLADDFLLGQALETAIAEALVAFPSIAQPFRVAISIAAIDDSVFPHDFKHAGRHFGDTYYSASLVKMGALYAAFELMQSVNNLAMASGAANAAQLFARLHAEFDPVIDRAVPLISSTPGITRDMRIPKYEQIFAVIPQTGGGVRVKHSGAFETHLVRMIANSDNNSAATCIRALGYSWINGVLHAAGFFFPPAQTGIWVGGTFTGSFPPVRIPSVNDGPTAQGTTCFDMATLYGHIFQGTLVNQDASRQMLGMLSLAATDGPDPSFLDFTRRHVPMRSFGVSHTKIGEGPLTSGTTVISEGSIVEHINSGRKFLTVFQNSFRDDPSVFAMGAIVERTIEIFITNP